MGDKRGRKKHGKKTGQEKKKDGSKNRMREKEEGR